MQAGKGSEQCYYKITNPCTTLLERSQKPRQGFLDCFDDTAAILNRKVFWGVQGASQNKDGALVGEFKLCANLPCSLCLAIGKGDRCAVFGCVVTMTQDIRKNMSFSAFDGSNELRFWKCRDINHYKIWTKHLKRVAYSVNGKTKIYSNHFKYGRPTDVDPHPTLFLKEYDEQCIKRTAPMERSTPPTDCLTRKRLKLKTDAIVHSSTATVTCEENESASNFCLENPGYMADSTRVSSGQDEMTALKQENEFPKKKLKSLKNTLNQG